jgi:RNA polymerase sigma factor (TIGR02999 family)
MALEPSHKDKGNVADRSRLDAIFQDYYTEIKGRIHQALRQESHLNLQTTDVLHDLYLKLANDPELSYEDKRAVLNLIALRTREYLVDQARRRNARKRGRDFFFVSLSAAENVGYQQPIDVLILNEALSKLAAESPLAAEVAHLRWFFGLTEKEIAPLVGYKRSTIQRAWEFTKIWLADYLTSRPHNEENPHGE